MMQQHVQFLGGEYDSKRAEAEKASKEADELREGMENFRESVLVRTAGHCSPFRRSRMLTASSLAM